MKMLRLVLQRSARWPAACLLACLACPPAQAQDAQFADRILKTHNEERARLGIPPLRWNPALAANAQRWAAHLSTLNVLEHDDSLDVEGENLWRGSGGAYTPEDMVTLWIDERVAFRNGVFPDVSASGQWEDVGHYTQVIWRTTGQVGCALGEAGEDEVLVCRYMEGGNFEGEKTY
jgi:hypothetical protein